MDSLLEFWGVNIAFADPRLYFNSGQLLKARENLNRRLLYEMLVGVRVAVIQGSAHHPSTVQVLW